MSTPTAIPKAKKRVIGMDIGPDAIRYAVLDGTAYHKHKKLRLIAHGAVALPGDPLKLEGEEKRRAVGTALFKLKLLIKPRKSDKLTVSLSGYLTSVHILPVPPGSPRPLLKILEQEALTLLPKENRDSFYYATGLLPEDDEGNRRGVVSLSRADDIDFDLLKMSQCGFIPQRILLGALSWRHLPCVKHLADDKLHVICEVGAKFTRVLFTRGAHLLSARQIPIGWGACRKVLHDNLHLSNDEADLCLRRWLAGKPLFEPEDLSRNLADGIDIVLPEVSGENTSDIVETFELVDEEDDFSIQEDEPQQDTAVESPTEKKTSKPSILTEEQIEKAEGALERHGGRILREVNRFLAMLQKEDDLDFPVNLWFSGPQSLVAQAKTMLSAESSAALDILQEIDDDAAATSDSSVDECGNAKPCGVALGLACAGTRHDELEADLLPEQVAMRRHDSLFIKIAAAVLLATLPLPWLMKDIREHALWTAAGNGLAEKATIAVDRRKQEKLLHAQEAQLQTATDHARQERDRQRVHALLLAAANNVGGGRVWIRQFSVECPDLRGGKFSGSSFMSGGFNPGGFNPGGFAPAPTQEKKDAPVIAIPVAPMQCELKVEASSYAVVEEFAKALAGSGWVQSIDIRRAGNALDEWKETDFFKKKEEEKPEGDAQDAAPAPEPDHVLVTLVLEAKV